MNFKDALTDFHNTADTGRIVTPIVLGAMIVIQIISTWKSPTHAFDPQSFGIGCASVIAALAAYIWGDAKGQQIAGPPPPGTVIDTTKRTIEVTPPSAAVATAEEVNQYHAS